MTHEEFEQWYEFVNDSALRSAAYEGLVDGPEKWQEAKAAIALRDKLLQEAAENYAKQAGEIVRLKDFLKRFLGYELAEYDMKPEDLDGDLDGDHDAKGIFTPGFWAILKEARERARRDVEK
jgi:hypothetical protein